MVTNKGGGQSSGEMAGASGLEEGPNGEAHWRSGVKPRVITWPHWKGSNLKTLKTKASWWKYHKTVWLWELIVKKQMIIEAKNLIRDNHNLLWKQVITFYPDGKWLWVSLRLLLQAIILWWDASVLNSSKKKKKCGNSK